MKRYVIPACIAASIIAGIAVAEEGDDCELLSINTRRACDTESYVKFDTAYSVTATFNPIGCSIINAHSGANVAGIAIASTRKTIETSLCVWEDFDFNLDKDEGSSVSVEATSAIESTISSSYDGSAEANASESGVTLTTSGSHSHVFGYEHFTKDVSSEDFRIIEVIGHAFSSGTETAFAVGELSGGCTGLTGGLEVSMFARFSPFCEAITSSQKGDSCPRCSIGSGSINLAYSLNLRFVVDGARSVAHQQGVIRLASDGNGAYSADQLGMFSDSAFAPGPIGDGYGLNVVNHLIPLNVPANATKINVTQSQDVFEHDGDINGDGLFCELDDAAMSALVGSTIGDGVYNPRGDFDLDGDIDAADRAAFEAIFPG